MFDDGSAGMERLEEFRARVCAAEVERSVEGVEPLASSVGSAVQRLVGSAGSDGSGRDPAGVDGPGMDWAGLDGDAAMATVVELESARRGLDAVLAEGMARMDGTGVTERASGLAAHNWLGHTTRGPKAAAQRDVHIGRAMTWFPVFAEAARAGELSTDHLAALHGAANTRVRDDLIGAGATLLEMARSVSFEVFCKNLRVIARQLDVDGAEPDCSEVDDVAMGVDGNGDLHLRARFSGHHAVEMERALRDELDRQWRAAAREQAEAGTPMPPAGVLRARAMVELVRRGLAGDPATATSPRTEAIVEIRHDEHGHPHASSIDGEPLDEATAAVLACDAWLQPVVIADDGTPLFCGRGVRHATPAQRRALILRDGGCVFPGCDAPASWCDAHHIIPWEQDGDTDLSNLALLCRRHHGLAHSRNWILEAIPARQADPDGEHPPGSIHLAWHTPNGRTIPAQTATSRRGGPNGPGDPPGRRAAA